MADADVFINSEVPFPECLKKVNLISYIHNY